MCIPSSGAGCYGSRKHAPSRSTPDKAGNYGIVGNDSEIPSCFDCGSRSTQLGGRLQAKEKKLSHTFWHTVSTHVLLTSFPWTHRILITSNQSLPISTYTKVLSNLLIATVCTGQSINTTYVCKCQYSEDAFPIFSCRHGPPILVPGWQEQNLTTVEARLPQSCAFWDALVLTTVVQSGCWSFCQTKPGWPLSSSTRHFHPITGCLLLLFFAPFCYLWKSQNVSRFF